MKRKSKKSKKSELARELKRQSIHAAGIAAVPVILFLNRSNASAILGGTLIALMILAFYRARKRLGSRWLDKFILKVERPGELPLNGAIFFLMGVFAAFMIFSPVNAAAAAAVLALGDSASTVVGKLFGHYKLPGDKSIEGSMAFYAVALLTLMFFTDPMKAIGIALVATAVEALPKMEDNFTVPITVGLLMTLL